MRVSNVPAITRRYWAAILVASMCGANTGDAARTAGTTLGDLLASRHGLDLGLPLSTTITASMLAIIVLFWPHPSNVKAAVAR
jgi:uncharacterized membrane-anchored protein